MDINTHMHDLQSAHDQSMNQSSDTKIKTYFFVLKIYSLIVTMQATKELHVS